MRHLVASLLTAAMTTLAVAQDKKGTVVDLVGMKSATPADWKDTPLPPGSLRYMQFQIPKADGDSEATELAIFNLVGGGSVQANIERQDKKFELAPGTMPKTEKIKVGKYDAVYQDISGTYLKKSAPFDPNANSTRVPDFRQLYVIFEAREGDTTRLISMYLIGPSKTVAKHKDEFDQWLKNFK